MASSRSRVPSLVDLRSRFSPRKLNRYIDFHRSDAPTLGMHLYNVVYLYTSRFAIEFHPRTLNIFWRYTTFWHVRNFKFFNRIPESSESFIPSTVFLGLQCDHSETMRKRFKKTITKFLSEFSKWAKFYFFNLIDKNVNSYKISIFLIVQKKKTRRANRKKIQLDVELRKMKKLENSAKKMR